MKLRIPLVIFLAISGMLLSPTEALAVMQSLDGVSTQDQTFTDDSNVTMTPSGSAHVIGWQGQLPVSRGGTGAGSFTAGSLLFSNGTTFAQDNSNLFWDDINNRIGIGTSSPSSTLDVAGNTSISGNLNVTGNITGPNLVPYIGATSDVNLGNHSLILGVEGSSSGIEAPSATTQNTNGSGLTLLTGEGLGDGNGGVFQIVASDAGDEGSGIGGRIFVEAGAGGQVGGDGGFMLFRAGDARAGNSNGGNLVFEPGQKAGSGTSGQFIITDAQSNRSVILDTSLLTWPGPDFRTFSFPDFSGTFGLLEANQTFTGLNKFEAASNSTIYVGSSSKTSCIVLGDSDGSGVTYITANDGVLSASSTKPSICQ